MLKCLRHLILGCSAPCLICKVDVMPYHTRVGRMEKIQALSTLCGPQKPVGSERSRAPANMES